MLEEVTQKNVYRFIPAKAATIICRMKHDRDIELKDALLAFYRSPVYHMLETESTKLWHDSGEQIYDAAPGDDRPRHFIKSGPSRLRDHRPEHLVLPAAALRPASMQK